MQLLTPEERYKKFIFSKTINRIPNPKADSDSGKMRAQFYIKNIKIENDKKFAIFYRGR